MSFARIVSAVVVVVCLGICTSLAQNGAATANSDPTYAQLRKIGLGEAVTVSNLDFKRDAATFHLQSGTVCFVQPVRGKVTGAVFTGEGTMVLTPPNAAEARSLKLLSKSDEFVESFNKLVLRFTDGSYEEIKKAGTAASAGCDAGSLEESQHTTRKKLNYNLTARILEDVLRAGPGGLFVAFVHGKKYEDKMLYIVDPNGAISAAPEQVELMTYNDNRSGSWSSFEFSKEYREKLGAAAVSSDNFHIEHQVLDTTIEKNAHLSGKAVTVLVSESEGMRVVPFDLFRTLRVESVTASDGTALSFIQEDKNDDPDFYVILPKPLAKGEQYTITTVYTGKDAITNEGNGNYYPIARDNWYPGNAAGGLGDYANFDLTFRIPKGMKIAATGSLISESTNGDHDVTVWKSDTAQPVAGFQFGRMKEQEAKLTSPPDFLVAAYANEDPPDWAKSLQGGMMGNLSTVSMMKQPLQEAQVAVGLYTNYFGPLPFKRLSMTQQTACDYGQSWPGLVWLPICSFYDITVRHQLGLDFSDNGYWEVVTPHEVAHQWWGQLVGFGSYRDQWMSEGFADFSASLFLQSAYGNDGQKKFMKFWDDERRSIVEKNAQGFRAIDVGPVTMGYRLNNSRAGFNIARNLIYPKGAYILHMVRMMMRDQQTGDQNFREMLQDFTHTYGGHIATTEDFKAMVEKHMTPQMKAFGNGSMDWFFNEYVYGTSLPSYDSAQSSFDLDPSGNVNMNLKIAQSGVDNNFRMLVGVYIEMSDGKVATLGRVGLMGTKPIDEKVPLGKLPGKPRRVILNYYDDVLASN